jgi:hypothetical protein
VGIFRAQEDELSSLRNYVPDQCAKILRDLGATFLEPKLEKGKAVRPIPEDERSALESFFRIFSRNSGASEQVIQLKLGTRLYVFQKVILPALQRHQIVRSAEYRGKGHQSRFELNYPLDVILKGEDPNSATPTEVKDFWEELRS